MMIKRLTKDSSQGAAFVNGEPLTKAATQDRIFCGSPPLMLSEKARRVWRFSITKFLKSNALSYLGIFSAAKAS